MTHPAPSSELTCSKCGAHSGNDWEQCKGSCPMPGSPHYDPSPKPDVAGARERLLNDLAAGNDENIITGADDLRLILSAYDRQGEEIERLRCANLCKADLWWNPGNDEAGFTHYADAFEDANEDGEDYSVELNRGIVLPSVWAALIDGKIKVFATEAEADAARARQGGPDHG